MQVNKAVFTWKKLIPDPGNFGNMQRLDVIFEEGMKKPTIVIDAGDVRIEDRSFEIDCKEVLRRIGEIDFRFSYDAFYPNEFTGDRWELIINDKKYEGKLEEPHYVVRIRKIIRLNAILVYANKKLGMYMKK